MWKDGSGTLLSPRGQQVATGDTTAPRPIPLWSRREITGHRSGTCAEVPLHNGTTGPHKPEIGRLTAWCRGVEGYSCLAHSRSTAMARSVGQTHV